MKIIEGDILICREFYEFTENNYYYSFKKGEIYIIKEINDSSFPIYAKCEENGKDFPFFSKK